MTRHIVASIATMIFLAACGGEVVAVGPPPPVAVPAAPAEVTPSEFQPCKAPTDCHGTPNTVVGPCQEGRKTESRWSCVGDRCVPVAECI
jgi:hypothetical protein